MINKALPQATALFACALLIVATPVRGEDSVNHYFVFLNTGKERQRLKGVATEKVTALQNAHVGNLGKLGSAGKALTAGPLGDNGFIRGIVILKLDSWEKPDYCFVEDPFVMMEVLDAESHPYLCDASKLHYPQGNYDMAVYTNVIIKKGPKWKPETATPRPSRVLAWSPVLTQLFKENQVGIYGMFTDKSDKLGVVILTNKDVAAYKTRLDADPGVKSGRLIYELHPQYLAKGIFY